MHYDDEQKEDDFCGNRSKAQANKVPLDAKSRAVYFLIVNVDKFYEAAEYHGARE